MYMSHSTTTTIQEFSSFAEIQMSFRGENALVCVFVYLYINVHILYVLLSIFNAALANVVIL